MNNLEVLKIQVNLNSEEYNMDLSNDMTINVADINESYENQPSRYAWWATLAALARSKANQIKRRVERETDYLKTTLTGTLDGKIRVKLEYEGEKVTETKVSNAICTDPEYLAYKEKINQLQEDFEVADEQARLLEVGRETMNQRKEMLISLGAQLRNEYDGVNDFYTKGKSESEKVASMKEVVGKKQKSRRVPILSSDNGEE